MPATKRKKKAAPKKQSAGNKKKRTTKRDDPMLLLPDDMLMAIGAFCEVRDLLYFTLACPEVESALSHKTIIEVVCAKGGETQRVLELLVRGVDRMEVLMPSPMRLLRVVNGTCCEMCEKRAPRGKRLEFFHDGVMCCRSCYGESLYTFDAYNGKFCRDIKKIIADNVFDPDFLWSHIYKDSSGIQCGPVWSYDVIESVYLGEKKPEQHLRKLEVYEDTYDEFAQIYDDACERFDSHAPEKLTKQYDDNLKSWACALHHPETDESEKEEEEWGYKRPYWKRF